MMTQGAFSPEESQARVDAILLRGAEEAAADLAYRLLDLPPEQAQAVLAQLRQYLDQGYVPDPDEELEEEGDEDAA
jgi:hypothetical protein